MRTILFALVILNTLLTACTTSVAPISNPEPASRSPIEDSPEPHPTIPPQLSIPTQAPLTGRLVFSADNNGRWDVNMANADGGAWARLTSDGMSRAPTVSSDGARIAFETHRDGNWEIYTMDTTGNHQTRVTHTLAFDGQPTWSPDGTRLAFTSLRQDDFDIWIMNSNGTNASDLTRNSSVVDDTPAWSPDGQWIAFTSWRTSTAQIFILSPDGKQTINLSQNKFNDQMPAWSPDGKQIAFVSDRDGQRAIYVADFSMAGLKNVRRLTFSGWDDVPTWSPDGKYIVFVSPRPSRQAIYTVSANGGIPVAFGDGIMRVRSVAWANISTSLTIHLVADPPLVPLYPPPPKTPASLIPLKDVYLAPSWGQMSDRVSSSFEALRARVKAEVGWDFLGTLSDMARQLSGGVCGDGCQDLSWHKTGRAVDTRLAVESAGNSLLEIVREDQLGETYWRVYLRAAKQDGTQGEPLQEPPWDWTYYARWTLAPHQGGVTKTIPIGYYVDFTELARQYGWNRISSYDDPMLSWKENNVGMEFWHFQKTDGLTWYAALQELYSDQTLKSTFDWNALVRQKEDAYLMTLKGVPAAPSAWRWSTLIP